MRRLFSHRNCCLCAGVEEHLRRGSNWRVISGWYFGRLFLLQILWRSLVGSLFGDCAWSGCGYFSQSCCRPIFLLFHPDFLFYYHFLLLTQRTYYIFLSIVVIVFLTLPTFFIFQNVLLLLIFLLVSFIGWLFIIMFFRT